MLNGQKKKSLDKDKLIILSIAVIAFIGLVIGARWQMVGLNQQISTLQRFEQQGITTDALVTEKWLTGRNLATPHMKITFMAGGQGHSFDSTVSVETFNSVDEGDLIAVTYLPSNPNITLIENEKEDLSSLEVQRTIFFVFSTISILSALAVTIWITLSKELPKVPTLQENGI